MGHEKFLTSVISLVLKANNSASCTARKVCESCGARSVPRDIDAPHVSHDMAELEDAQVDVVCALCLFDR